jgi:hypothetical protein
MLLLQAGAGYMPILSAAILPENGSLAPANVWGEGYEAIWGL